MQIGVLKETKAGETRVAFAPETVKKVLKKNGTVCIERGAGVAAGFPDETYEAAGAKIVSRDEALAAAIILKICPPEIADIKKMKKGALLLALLEPFDKTVALEPLAQQGVDAISLEWIPRTSRAQSMDVLSSQANIAGYRAVIEACLHFNRFFPSMMTSAGMAKPARLIVLGAGVAGLQAIATARRLGAHVEAFDVRPEVKEQILSLGAKFIDLNLGEVGTGAGGYAKELSAEARIKQQDALTEKLMSADVVISTANIPGKKAPVLITEMAVKGMRAGSVVIDMAASSGGNCPLTQSDRTVEVNGVKIVGITNYPALVAADSSRFFGNNLVSLLELILKNEGGATTAVLDLNDDIISGSLAVHLGQIILRKIWKTPDTSAKAIDLL